MTKGEVETAKRRALTLLDEWNNTTGFILRGCGYQYEIEGLIEDAVEIGIKAALGLDYSDVGKDPPTKTSAPKF